VSAVSAETRHPGSPSGAFAGERAVVVGFGESGRAAAIALLAEGAQVRVSEARERRDVAGSEIPGAELLAGGHRPEHLDGATVVVASPGVPPTAPVLAWAMARDLPVWSELELGARLCTVPVVAVTGTNGKTTTVELVAAAMRAGGLAAVACGNVGYPFSTAAREPFEALAVEASSFQLRFTESLHPRVSVLLNLAPDHLDWHGDVASYAEAKGRIYARQGAADVHVGNLDDHAAAQISRAAPCPVLWFRQGAPSTGEVGVVEGAVVAPSREDLFLGRPRSSAPGLLADAAAAAAASLSFGIEPAAIAEAVSSFEPLPHRGEVVATVESVRFVDDSKATNPHAALMALDGMEGAVLIAGGLAKGVDLSPLASAAPRLSSVVTIGEAASTLASVFDGLVPVRTASTIEDAVGVAFGLAAPGRTVVLAPACASQDMFRDYRERGDRFATAARALADRATRDRTTGRPRA
jgi:UDP-N-acetylmuramoylalanine--D-glutamate ligase